MTKGQASLIWLISLVLLAVTAGQSWRSFQVSESAGGGVIHISGFLAFPVIGTLISLQIVLFLVSFLVKPLVFRVLATAVVPLLLWNFFDVLLNSASRVQATFIAALAEQTGVMESFATSEFLVSSSGGVFSLLFLMALGVNSLLMVVFGLVPFKKQGSQDTKANQQHPEDLWSSQN